MIVLSIVALIVGSLLLVLMALAFRDDEPVSGFMLLLAGVVCIALSSSSFLMYNLGVVGGSPWCLKQGVVYRVVDCVKVAGGEYDGQYLYNLRDATNEDTFRSVFYEKKIDGPFVRVTTSDNKDNRRWVLEAVPVEPAKGILIENPIKDSPKTPWELQNPWGIPESKFREDNGIPEESDPEKRVFPLGTSEDDPFK